MLGKGSVIEDLFGILVAQIVLEKPFQDRFMVYLKEASNLKSIISVG